MSTPAFSIITPVHNRASELRSMIDSVRAQTLADWELLIVDDRSTDGALEVAIEAAKSDPRVRSLSSNHPGAPAARNTGVQHSTGKLVIFLDSDDLLHPQALQWRARRLTDDPGLDFVITQCELFFDSPGDACTLWNQDNSNDDLLRFVSRDMPWQTTSPTWRRSALEKIGPWQENIKNGQDLEFHTRALLAGLNYAREPKVDHYWRLPGPARSSIGKDSYLKSETAYARFDLLVHLINHLRPSARWDAEFRQYMAGHWFDACWWLAHRVNVKDARKKWRQSLTLGLVDRKRYLQGSVLLWKIRLGYHPRTVINHVRDHWPREMYSRTGKFFNKAPIPGRAPTISVIMSAYNVERYIDQAVESVLAQSWRDFEFIIIDDGSTDLTRAKLERLAQLDGRIKLVCRENKGLTVSLNQALRLSTGQFIARMDGDDIAMPDRFRQQLTYFRQHPECVLVGSKVMLIDPYDVPIVEGEHVPNHAEIDRDMMLGKNPIYHPSVLMRRDAVERVGGYDEKYNNAEDLDLFLKLAEIGQLHSLDELLLHYRRHPGSVNHTKFKNQWRMVRQIVADAHARRGIAMPADWGYAPWKPQPHAVQVKLWGWKALQAGKPTIARRHAIDAIKHGPFDQESWKLLACAIRGR